MTITVNMQAPNGLVGESVVAGAPDNSGSTYVVSANGIVTGVNASDVNALFKMGFRELPQPGSAVSTAVMGNDGNLYSVAAAQTALSPSSTGGDYVLAVYSLPANFFDGLGVGQRAINIKAVGSTGANNNVKRAKLYFNPTAAVVGSTVSGGNLLADTANFGGTSVGWVLEAEVMKYGAPNSNTQVGTSALILAGSTFVAPIAPVFCTGTENGAILVCVTGNPVTTSVDISLNLFEITAKN